MSLKIDQIIRSDRKTISAEVTIEGYIIVRAPLNAPSEMIEDFLNEKKFYLLRNQQINKTKYLNDLHKKYEEGENFLYLGKERPLKIVTNKSIPLKYENGTFYLSNAFLKLANKVFVDWYKERAAEKLSELCLRYSKLFNISYERILIKESHSQWGSCSGKGILSFSWRAILVPHEVISYLVVHELAHIIYPNHSKDYWTQVEVMMPEYMKYDNWINNNSHIIQMFKNDVGSLPKNNNKIILDKNDQLEFEL